MNSAKQYKEQLKTQGVFYTDPKLGTLMRSYFPNDVKEIYDPTCGSGALLDVFENAVKYGQDINDCTNPNIIFKKGDTLKEDLFSDKRFDYIISNPPYSIKWEQDKKHSINGIMPPASKADYAFILHCYKKVNKVFVILAFPGILYRGNAEGKIREALIKEKHIKLIRQIPSGFFEDTKIQTTIIVFDKEKEYEEIEFINENQKSRKVSLDEIEKNNFTLSVSIYVQEITQKEVIDINELNKQILDISLENFKKKLAGDYFVYKEFGNKHFPQYIDNLLKVVQKYKRGETRKIDKATFLQYQQELF